MDNQGAVRDPRSNNFNILRLAAACFVFAGHMALIVGDEPLNTVGFPLHDIGVAILFLIGGYLISKSWKADRHVGRYAVRRFLRFWPPFAVVVLLMTFVTGPMVSDLGFAGYFGSNWWTLYLQNLRFFIIYAQPGVFTKLPRPNVTNGSLWTMPVELLMYILTPLILRNKKRSLKQAMIPVGILCAVDLAVRAFFPDLSIIVYGTDLVPTLHLSVFYALGMLFAHEDAGVLRNPQIGGAAFLVLMLVQGIFKPIRYLVLFVAMPVLVFSFALAPEARFRKLGTQVELSYGIYLYGFFFQQLIVQISLWYGFRWGYMTCLLLSGIPTVGMAMLSSLYVEKPLGRLTKYFCARIGRRVEKA